MTVIKSEFYLALNQVATDRGIPLSDVLDSIKAAVLAAYKKDYEQDDNILEEGEEEKHEVVLNEETGEMHIMLEGKDITPPGFGRIAAQTARQVILQKIREAEKREVVKHYQEKIGTIIRGRVIRYDGRNVYFDIGKAEGLLPAEEKIRTEDYNVNNPYTLYIKEIREDDYGNSRIILSRTDTRLVEELFKKEVPEIANDTVQIKGIVREPGRRTKIAVFSDQSGVDPVGACVGQKGIRVKSVNDELGADEKIDIIQYHENLTNYIREALSPAKVKSVEVDTKKMQATVFVDADQAPLAIGDRGVNVNLAGALTGCTIDIKQEDLPPVAEESTEITEETETETPSEEAPAIEAVEPTEGAPEEVTEQAEDATKEEAETEEPAA